MDRTGVFQTYDITSKLVVEQAVDWSSDLEGIKLCCTDSFIGLANTEEPASPGWNAGLGT